MTFLHIIILIHAIVSANADFGAVGDIYTDYESAFDQELYERVLDADKCEEQLNFLATNTSIGMEFIDASGKIPSGILSGNLADLGSYFQCLAIKHESNDMDIEGKYCVIQVPLKQASLAEVVESPNSDMINLVEMWPRLENSTADAVNQLMQVQRQVQMTYAAGRPVSRVIPSTFVTDLNMSWGTCIPKVCRSKQAIDFFLRRSFLNMNLTYNELYCRLPNDKPFSIADYIAVSILSLLILISILSTSYDLWHLFVLKTDNAQINVFLRCFSIYTNTKRFLSFPTVPGALECVDGIRAISMLWVIFGHVYSMTMLMYVYNVKDVFDWLTSFKSTWINAAPISVDTFFTLSGILCVYTIIGKISRCKFVKTLHFYYLYRLLRILPLLAVAVLLQASLFHRMSDGPVWVNVGYMTVMCRRRWWSALLHVQNYVRPTGVCLYQSWYLSVDIQLYIISPLVLIWLFASKTAAWIALALSILISLASSTVFSFLYNYSAALASPSRMDEFFDYFTDYYVNTLTRAPPFFIGMAYGYLLQRCRGKEVSMGKILVTIAWILAFAMMAFCIFSNYPIMQLEHDLQMFDNFLNAYMRAIWSVALGWLIFACVHGYGGPIDWFLSLRMWKLPARLSYAMYLLHFSIIMITNGSMTSTYYFTDANTIHRALGDLVFTVLGAFILSVTVDAPFSTIQKLLLGGGKKNPKKIDAKATT